MMTVNNKPKIVSVAIDKIIPYEKNAKIHSKEQIAKLAASIKDLGWDQPIVVDEEMIVIKGHGRLLAAKSLGMTVVPTIIRDDLSPNQVRSARLADNRLSSTDYDTTLLSGELTELHAEDVDLSLLGFDERETSFVLNDPGSTEDAAFVDDVGAATDAHAQANQDMISEIDGAEVPIAKALGFKTVPSAAAREMGVFMSLIEAETGKQGGAALVEFVKTVVAR